LIIFIVGWRGSLIKVNPASSGVLSPFFRLHDMQLVTIFNHSVFPPLDLGITWSIVRFFGENFFPQYWHVNPSLMKTPSLDTFGFDILGSISVSVTIILGIFILLETVEIYSSPSSGSNLIHSQIESVSKFSVRTFADSLKSRENVCLKLVI
jgi:hypothetical protein